MEHRVTSGMVISQTFSVYVANFVPFFLITGLLLGPLVVLNSWLLMKQLSLPEPSDAIGWAIILVSLLNQVVGPLATGAMAYGVFQHIRGRPTTISDCLSTGLRRLLPVLGVGIVAGLLMLLGLLLCLIPGIVVLVVFAAAVPAAVIEKTGVMDSLRRSRDLTEGNRWTVFGVVFGIGLLGLLVSYANQRLATSIMVYLVVGGLIGIIFTGLQATSLSLLYYHLRKAKEAIDVEEIAAVFD